MLSEFIALIRSHIGKAIYCWGGQGEIVTSEQQIRNAETSEANALRAIKFWRYLQSLGVNPVYKDDCSGLEVWPLMKLGLLDHDLNANSFSLLTGTIPKSELRVGDLVFNLDDAGRAFHMGTVTRFVGSLAYVTEAYGRDKGVIERPITFGYWDDFGHNPFIDTSEVSDEMKKGDTGPAVQKWQELLISTGYPMTGTDGTVYGADGNFGGATERATIAFQTASNLPGSGIVGDMTWAAMVTATSAKLATALQDEAARAAYLVGQVAEGQKIISAKIAQINSLTAETVAAKAGQLAAEQYAALKETALVALNSKVDVIRKGRDALAGL